MTESLLKSLPAIRASTHVYPTSVARQRHLITNHRSSGLASVGLLVSSTAPARDPGAGRSTNDKRWRVHGGQRGRELSKDAAVAELERQFTDYLANTPDKPPSYTQAKGV
jgi:hypothetical protein